MLKKNKKVIAIISVITVVFIGATYIVGGMVYDGSIGSKPEVAVEVMAEYYENSEDKPLEKLDNYNYEKSFIKSEKNGYDIEVVNIKSNKETNNVMVVVHGIERNYHDVLNTSFNYLENGYNVVVYNQRQTGNTGGDNYTFGLYERFDLDSVVDYTSEIYKDGLVGVHGFSMGAATATMHTELNEEKKTADFYILDAPFHTMKSAIKMGAKRKDVPLIPVSYAAFAGNIYTKLKSGFFYNDVKPFEAVKNITTPVMLIHGTEDDYTSADGSKIIYDTIPHDKKELWLIDGLKHCEADDLIEDEYFERIYNFIDEKVKNINFN